MEQASQIMTLQELKPGDIVRHSLFTQANHLLVIRKLGESTYGCRHYIDGQFFYTEFEVFELEKVTSTPTPNSNDMIIPS